MAIAKIDKTRKLIGNAYGFIHGGNVSYFLTPWIYIKSTEAYRYQTIMHRTVAEYSKVEGKKQ